MRAAWPKLEYVFSVRRSNEEGKSEASPEPAHVIREPHRLSNGLSNQHPVHPVHLLTIEQGISSKFAFEFRAIRLGKLVGRMKPENRPRVVIESWPPNTQLWTKGPACKSTTSRWYDLNYVSRFKRVAAIDVGGAINQSRLLVARVKYEWSHLWMWGAKETDLETARPILNILTPPGLVRSSYVQGHTGDPIAQRYPMPGESHLWMWGAEETNLETAGPMPNILTPPGLVRSSYVQGHTGDPIAQRYPMPGTIGAYIQTEHGTR